MSGDTRTGGPRGASGARGASGTILTLYADGASRGNPGPAGAGAVLAAEDGTELERLRRYLGRATNNEAEYRAVILGLRAAIGRRPRHVRIYLDSQLVVRQLLGEYRVKHPRLAPLHREASELIRKLPGCTIEHIERSLNAVADRLANEAIDCRGGGASA